MSDGMGLKLRYVLALCLTTSVLLVFNGDSRMRCLDVIDHEETVHRELEQRVTKQTHLNQSKSRPTLKDVKPKRPHQTIKVKRIPCLINQEYLVDCRMKRQNVFVPFSFLRGYFKFEMVQLQVRGEMRNVNGHERFEWNHSYSEVHQQIETYSPTGAFMFYENYRVENRRRVRCISGIEELPVSKQWGPQGHFYPIQIAQFGLSHWSKYKVKRDKRRNVTVLENAEKGTTDKWMIPDTSVSVDNVIDDVTGSRVIKINASEELWDPGAGIRLDVSTDFFLSFDFLSTENGSFTITVETRNEMHKLYYLHYVCSETMIAVKGNNIFYGIGNRSRWSRITRDVYTDVLKRLQLEQIISDFILHRVLGLEFHGLVFVDNITLSDNAHLTQFTHAANWLAKHQDDRGGWPVKVNRTLAEGKLTLLPGWYNAMAQGEAMSLLVRAFKHTGDQRYLDAALRGTLLFDVPSAEGGVFAKFLGKYPWYEAFPTVPGSFVLNGFLYSLLGLYDLKETAPPELGQDAERLYAAGVKTLKLVLPLFDAGSGTFYDLFHFTMGISPNLARWDYHSTQAIQLYLLATIEKEPLFYSTAGRWARYMKGEHAPIY